MQQLSDPDFLALLGGIYEDSPWVAENVLARRPFGSLDDLRAAMRDVVEGAGREAQLALLRAHPELARRAQMSPDSVAEQRGAGLDALTPDEHARLIELNGAYRERFGFPFILAVKGKDKNDIRRGLEERLSNAPDEEFRRALDEVHQIAAHRLQAQARALRPEAV